MSGLSAHVSLGAGCGESGEDGRKDLREDDERSSEAARFESAVSLYC